ncbi:MAG: hypothetical protein HY050_02815 [Actinobacteria bacterium]|nr:hypothetical protein [Actinomycetota bacterium]
MMGRRSGSQLFRVAFVAIAAVLTLQGATPAMSEGADVTPPQVDFYPGGPYVTPIVGGTPVASVPIGKAFTVQYYLDDDSEQAKATMNLYSQSTLVSSTSSTGLLQARRTTALWGMSAPQVAKSKNVGPFYLCISAEDAAGNKSLNAPRSVCAWLSIEVPLQSTWVSNGCGGQGLGKALGNLQNAALDVRKYSNVTVDFRPACNVHDAGYSGLTVKDPIMNLIIDFRAWTRKQVDFNFYQEIGQLCINALGKGKVAGDVLLSCYSGLTLAKYTTLFVVASAARAAGSFYTLPLPGARTYYDAVRKIGKLFYDTDITQVGIQTNNKPLTFPTEGGRDNS